MALLTSVLALAVCISQIIISVSVVDFPPEFAQGKVDPHEAGKQGGQTGGSSSGGSSAGEFAHGNVYPFEAVKHGGSS